jgi:hypothetical protein
MTVVELPPMAAQIVKQYSNIRGNCRGRESGQRNNCGAVRSV